MEEKNHVVLEGVVKRKGIRRSFTGEWTSLFLEVPTSRGKMHIGALARLPEGAKDRLTEGTLLYVEGELDYEKRKTGGFEVFILARKIQVVAKESALSKDEEYAEFSAQ